ncbi:hypothetical protein WR25_02506 [Diploscapter pachys]|uniref:Uncharacterized protein n=1 Tax=Diploscapter pachys TaxID=2018661 RepID=A0A2A2K2J4_9BILA|nr:hypothetical protein WR25_02506 [Diploscapter pachys]
MVSPACRTQRMLPSAGPMSGCKYTSRSKRPACLLLPLRVAPDKGRSGRGDTALSTPATGLARAASTEQDKSPQALEPTPLPAPRASHSAPTRETKRPQAALAANVSPHYSQGHRSAPYFMQFAPSSRFA